MSIKIVLAVAAFALSFSAGQAFAEGEGNGNPFAFHAGGQTTIAHASAADAGSTAYPQPTGNATQPSYRVQLEPATSSEAPIQTANSLPRRFGEGSVTYAQAQSLSRYLTAQASKRHYLNAGSARL